MSVSSVGEMWSRRGGGYTSDDGKTVKADFTTAYQVVHSAGDSQDTILLASSLPRIRDTFPGKAGIFCKNVEFQPVGPVMSIVTAQWAGEMGTSETDTALNKPPEWSWANSKTNEAVDEDADGLPLCNTNGDLMEGFTKDVSDFTLTVVRNFASINTYALREYLDSTNSDSFGSPDSIWPAGTAALDTFHAQSVGDGDSQYYTVTAKIDFRVPYNTVAARAWWYRYRNEGLNERSGTKVTFSGGGGTGAAAYAVVSGGAVTRIVVTSGGRDFTSAPTVTITSTGSGTGATATASLSADIVTSVSVGAGGSDYTSGLIRAADNGVPVARPVSLKIDGTREYDAEAAVWIERKKKQFSLPYNALGLF